MQNNNNKLPSVQAINTHVEHFYLRMGVWTVVGRLVLAAVVSYCAWQIVYNQLLSSRTLLGWLFTSRAAVLVTYKEQMFGVGGA